MRQRIATITSQGQMTIPAAVRRHLGVVPSDKIAFVVEDDGSVYLTRPRSANVASLRGAAGSSQPLAWSKMQEIAPEYLSDFNVIIAYLSII